MSKRIRPLRGIGRYRSNPKCGENVAVHAMSGEIIGHGVMDEKGGIIFDRHVSAKVGDVVHIVRADAKWEMAVTE